MLNSELVKEIAFELSFDLCGITPINRFIEAPDGFRPTDIYKDCKSVIVFAKRVPHGPLYASTFVPYTQLGNTIIQEVDYLTLKFTRKLEDLGLRAVPIPSDDPYEYWEPDKLYGRAIISLRHSAQLAGLGVLGKNTLLINKQFGNMIQLGAILVDIELEGDPIAPYESCIDCDLCLKSCPTKALDGRTISQKLCRTHSIYLHEKGYVLKRCNTCRKVCPNAFGIK